MNKELVESVALGLAKIKDEAEALKVRKQKLLDLIVMPEHAKGTVTLKGETLNIKISTSEKISYDQEKLMDFLDSFEDWEDYFTISAKEDKKEVDNFIKTGSPQSKKLKAIRQHVLANPTITFVENKK